MTTASGKDLSRRDFFKIGFTAGVGLAVSFHLPADAGIARAAGTSQPSGDNILAPNAWLRIHPDSSVTVMVNHSEMGQGITTALSMIVAEELEADWSRVRAEIAPAADVYKNPAFGIQATGGSTSVETSWEILRKAGATAREMLVAAAAEKWEVPVAECKAQNSTVYHRHSGKRAEYGKLLEGAAAVKAPRQPRLKSADEFSIVGKRIPRLDSGLKARGKATFGIDVQLPGLLNAATVHAPRLGARPASVNDADARSMFGVRQVVKLESAVAVVADTFWQAHSAAGVLDVQWENAAGSGPSTPSIILRWEERIKAGGKAVRNDGDAVGQLERSAARISAAYTLPYQAHACPEPMNCTAHVRRDSCELWVPTQAQGIAQDTAANICGLSIDQVKVHTTYLGGGFGRRGLSDFVAEAVQLSKAVDAPVKLIWTREEDMRNDFYRPASHNILRAGLDENGFPTAWIHRAVGSAEFESLMSEAGPAFLPDWLPRGIKNWTGNAVAGLILKVRGSEDAMGGSTTMAYEIPHIRVEHIEDGPGVPVGFWRSVADSRNCFVVESFMDEIAAAGGIDPVELRLKLLKDSPRQSRVLQMAAEKSGWGKTGDPGVFQGVALHAFHGTPAAMVASVSVARSGRVKVHRVVCAVDCGTVINPKIVEAQLAGGIVFGLTATLKSSVTVEKGRIQQANFDDFPLLRMDEMPEVDVHIADSRRPPSGIGEVGVPPISPAVTNAIFSATGVRIRRLPVARGMLSG